jgi:hypothetical protein
VINYTHRGLGSELLPDQLGRELLPATAPETPLFGGGRSFFFSDSFCRQKQKQTKLKKPQNEEREKIEKLFSPFRVTPVKWKRFIG